MPNTMPNFFIVGAAKAGTTSLYNYLKAHPDVYMSPIKEPNYFASDIKFADFRDEYAEDVFLDIEDYFSHLPLQERHIAHINNEQDYIKLFEGSEQKLARGEISTSYLFSDTAASEIRNRIPEAKIIIVLRNPVERAYSHYLMDLSGGYTGDSFRRAIEKDMAHKQKGWGITALYAELGMYGTQIEHFLDIFPRNQIKILFFDDLKADPKRFILDVFSFLGLTTEHYNFEVLGDKHNTATKPKFKKLFYLLHHLLIIFRLKRIIPQLLKEKFKKIIFTTKIPSLSREDRKYIYPYFADEIEKLERLIGCDLSHWKYPNMD